MEKILNFTKKYWFSILILLISALGVYLRIHVYLFNRSLWMDEAGLANNLLLPHSILDNMTYKQASPPLFKLISLINIKLFGETEYIFRLFPMICGIAAIPMFWLIVKRVLNSKPAQAAAMMLFSINYSLIYYSSEFKQYSTDVLCTLVLIWITLKFDIKTCSHKILAAIAIVNASVFWFSHSSLFIMAGLFAINLLILKTDFKQNLKRLAIIYLPALLSFIVFYFLHLKSIHESTFMHEYWAEYFIDNLPSLIPVLRQTCIYVFFPCTNTTLMIIFMFLGILVMFFENKTKAIITTAPLFILLLLAIMKIYPFVGRLILFIIPLLLIYFTASLDLVLKGKKVLSFALIFIFIFANAGYIMLYPRIVLKPNIWLREEIRPLYEYIQKNIKPGDIIFTVNDAQQQNKFYLKKFKFQNEIIESRIDFKNPTDAIPEKTYIPFEKLEKGKRYYVVWDAYWPGLKNKLFPILIKYLSENTKVLSQYVYYEFYVFYVEKL